jgi:hypothetical protein
MSGKLECILGRRELLTRTAPACAMACLGLDKLPTLASLVSEQEQQDQDQHKFDVARDRKMSLRQQIGEQYNELFGFITTLRTELDDPELIRLLDLYSAEVGRRLGERQAQAFADNEFATFVNQFRPPRYSDVLTHEVVEDTETTFGLRVTECIWAEVFRAAGLGGDIGHAAVCNMDYYWPPAFNPDFRMERTQTLMQGHDQCNHRYLNTG